MKRMGKVLGILLVFVMVFTLLTGCSETTEETIKVTTQPKPMYAGRYTLEDIKERNGIYIAYEDGSFDRYLSQGLDFSFSANSRSFDGCYAPNDMLYENPDVVTSEDNIVVICDSLYDVILYPVNFEARALQTERSDGTYGFGHCESITGDKASIWFNYSNHEYEFVTAMYIDGALASEYPFEKTQYVFHPIPNSPKMEEKETMYSFLNQGVVTISSAQGTTLVDNTYSVNATYFDCYAKHRDGSIKDNYYLRCTPTADGYAKIEMEDMHGTKVPTGKYAVKFDMGKTYMVSIINWIAPEE